MKIYFSILAIFILVSSILFFTIPDSFSQSKANNLPTDSEQKFDIQFLDKINNKIELSQSRNTQGLDVSREISFHDVIILVDRFEKIDENKDPKILEQKNKFAQKLLKNNEFVQHIGGNDKRDKIIQELLDEKPKFIKKDVSRDNKQKLVSDLLEKHNVTEYYEAKSLSFVTARVPVQEILKVANYDFVHRIEDGDLKVISESDVSKQVIGVPNIPLSRDGTDVKVAVVDGGIRQYLDLNTMNSGHPDLPIGPVTSNGKIIDQIICDNISCSSAPLGQEDLYDDDASDDGIGHGTPVAGIIGGQGNVNSNFAGVASDSILLNVKFSDASASMVNALDWAVSNGADIINLSKVYVDPNATVNNGQCQDGFAETIGIIADEVVDQNVLLIKSAGNVGFNTSSNSIVTESITNPGCAYNSITVGAFDENGTIPTSDDILVQDSSRGPTKFTNPPPGTVFSEGRFKPEIVAPGGGITTTVTCDANSCNNYGSFDGTSAAAPHVSGAAAVLLEARPNYSALETKAALLIGATWNPNIEVVEDSSIDSLPSTFTASDFENLGIVNPNDPDYKTLNTWGFGSLNVAESVKLADFGNVPPGSVERILTNMINQGSSRTFTVSADANEQVKIILSWFHHPAGTISGTLTGIQISNLDFTVKRADNNLVVASSSSLNQNNEFVVFDAPITGDYVVEVNSPFVNPLFSNEEFVVASTHPIQFGSNGTTQLQAIINNDPSPDSAIIISANEGSTILLDGSASTGPSGFTFFWEEEPVSNQCNPLDLSNENNVIATVTITPQSEDCFAIIKLTVSDGQQPNDDHQAFFMVTNFDLPSAPTNLQATATSSSQINLSWTTPSSDGGLPIIGYKIERESPIGGGFEQIIENTSSTSTSYTDNDPNLLPNTEYNYKVAAINSLGAGIFSNPNHVMTEQLLADWLYKKSLIIDHLQVADDLTEFPLLISHTDSDLQSKAQSDGDDIIFTKSDGTTILPHEIEKWDNTTGELIAWVKTNLSGSVDTEIIMYYGNQQATNSEDPESVWNNNYKIVQHLHDDLDDRTLNNHDDGTNFSSNNIQGKIADAQSFDGTSYIDIPSFSWPVSQNQNGVTIEFWNHVASGDVSSNGFTFGVGEKSDWPYRMTAAVPWFDNKLYFDFGDTPNGGRLIKNEHTPYLDKWSHIVLTSTASGPDPKMEIYLDGQLAHSGSSASSPNFEMLGLSLGQLPGHSERYIGSIDEFRISNTVLSSDWIMTQYKNQDNPALFYDVGSEQS